MIKQLILSIIFAFLALISVQAQTVKGTVVDQEMFILEGANVYWINTTIGTATDDQGNFELIADKIDDKRMIVSYLGYNNDTISISKDIDLMVTMISEQSLSEIVVSGKESGGYISSANPIKTEVINNIELGKAACCDLAGCFNTNASVEPATTNIVTNAKELRILGLSGVYNQILLDGFPLFQGLSYTYGVSSVPGPLVGNIFISKGTNSVLQGGESIAGQINVLIQKPVGAPKLYLNAFANTFLESQYNVYGGFKIGKVNNLLGGHLVLPATKHDKNDDNFLDLPQLTRYELIDKWVYGDKTSNGWFNRGGARWTNEERTGGQTDFDANKDLGSSSVYGQRVKYNQIEVWDKTSYRIDEFNATSIILSGQYHKQNSWFGQTNYQAHQTLVNANLEHEYIYKNGSNIRGGTSFKYLDLHEDISFSSNPLNKTYAGKYQTKEVIPGIYAENTLFLKGDALTWMMGIRADHLNNFGWKATPRTLIKYTPKPRTDIRFSAGYGWHIPKIFAEQTKVLASQRDLNIIGQLEPEEAWNYGVNFTQKFERRNLQGTFTADFYQTRFLNHLQPRYQEDAQTIVFQNNTDPAVGNGAQAEVTLDLWDWVTVKTAYNFLDIRHKIDGEKTELDFVTRHRWLNTFSLAPKDQDWHLDLSTQWNGKKNLPSTDNFPVEFQRPAESIPFTMLNAQFTYKWKNFEWYIGCENILGYTQDDPIISAQNPFGEYFDTSFAWGPTKGREGYLGIRYTLK